MCSDHEGFNSVIKPIKEDYGFDNTVPHMNVVRVIGITEQFDDSINNFMSNYLPMKIGNLHFDFNPNYLRKEYEFYQAGLIPCFQRITDSIHMYGFEMDQHDFKKFIRKCIHIKHVHFESWILPNEYIPIDPYLEIPEGEHKSVEGKTYEFKIQRMSFQSIVKENGCPWGEDTQNIFENR